MKEKNNPVVKFFDFIVMRGFNWTYGHKRLSMVLAFGFMFMTFFSARWLGTGVPAAAE